MAGAEAAKYSFYCEHYEEHSQMTKEYVLSYFVPREGPNELSLFDIKNKRVFLKRGVYNQDGLIRLQDLYVGGAVTVCARQLKVVAYADAPTRMLFEKSCDHVHSVVSSAAYGSIGALLSAAASNGFTVKRVKTLPDQHPARRAVALELVGEDAVEVWQQVSGQVGDPGAISVGPPGPETEKLFERRDTTATHDSCSLCVVRPHAMREGHAGAVVSALLDAGLEISCMQTYSLLKAQAENFYEVYKTVLPSAQFSGMISELASGVCLAMEVRGEDAVQRLRELCGPFDVEIARHLRPGTLRANLGRDNVHNAVHCTDLPEDGVLESQYFFSILPTAA